MFRERLKITATGKQLLAHELDWMCLQTQKRWVGGVQLQPSQKNGYWSPSAERPVYQ